MTHHPTRFAKSSAPTATAGATAAPPNSEREQQRIGRDLHDGVCQYLAAIGRLVGCSFWTLRFAACSSGASLNRGHSPGDRLVFALLAFVPRRRGAIGRAWALGGSRHRLEMGPAVCSGSTRLATGSPRVSTKMCRLRPLTRLCASKLRGPPRSVVLTDWPSMITTDGQASRPAWRRACS